MGRTHATSGAVAAMALLPALAAATWLPFIGGAAVDDGWAVVVCIVAAAGGAMLPDFDHPHASTAQSVGPLTKLLASVIGAVSGGHRNGTHSLLGIAFFTAASYGIGVAGGVWLGVWLAFLFAVAAAAMRLQMAKTTMAHTVLCLVVGAALTFASTLWRVPAEAVTAGVAIGAAAHIAGDMLTKEGCPLLWPVVKFRFKVANLTTDHFGERVIVGPLMGVAAVALAAWHLGLFSPAELGVTLPTFTAPDWWGAIKALFR